jgi:hypothetical protein
MSKKLDQSGHHELEKLYQEQSDIEPDGGLDRLIRAQAEHAVQAQGHRRPAPWTAGAATAAALVLSVGVVIHQTDAPQVQPALMEAPTPEAGEAQSLGSAPMTARSAEIQADAAPAPQVMRSSAFVAEEEDADMQSAEQQLSAVRELLAAGNTDEARARLQELIDEYPDFSIPENLQDLLRANPD